VASILHRRTNDIVEDWLRNAKKKSKELNYVALSNEEHRFLFIVPTCHSIRAIARASQRKRRPIPRSLHEARKNALPAYFAKSAMARPLQMETADNSAFRSESLISIKMFVRFIKLWLIA